MAREAVFSEGRGLRVRKCGPDASRGIPFSPDKLTTSRWPRVHMPRSNRSLPCGRAEPAPPGGGLSELGWPSWESPEMTRKVVFSVGCALRVRVARPYVRRDIFIFTPCVDDDSAAYRGDGWMGPMVSLRACDGRAEPAPPRGGKPTTDGLAEEGPEMTPGVVFSEGRTLCVRVARPN
jgi:hypothetical protein